MLALLSVTKKEPEEGETFMGIREFARELIALGWNILGSKGTAGHLIMDGIRAEVLGVDIMDHAVATLSIQKSGGLLAKRKAQHLTDLQSIGAQWIDLVCCDLYDLASALANDKLTDEERNDKVDIGGPTMLSECAKGSLSGRIVICDPDDRRKVIDWIKEQKRLRGQVSEFVRRPHDGAISSQLHDWLHDEHGEPLSGLDSPFKRELAAKADAHVAAYRLLSAEWRGRGRVAGVVLEQVGEDLLYGENPQMKPGRKMRRVGKKPHALAPSQFTQVAGTSPSYNNLQDLSAGIDLITRLAATIMRVTGWKEPPPIAIGMKHTLPCGLALAGICVPDLSPETATELMVAGDPRALFGGAVITNFPITPDIARILRRYKMPEPVGDEKPQRRPIDLVAAPAFEEGAVERFKRPGDKCRLLMNPKLGELSEAMLDTSPRLKQLYGGDWLQQPANPFRFSLDDPDLVRHGRVDHAEDELDLMIAAEIGSGAVSNTIAIVRGGMLLGLGCGQQDRVTAAKLAVDRALAAGHVLTNAFAYSDSFFPFPDGAVVLADAGIRAIYTSSGSVNDEAVIAACRERGVALYMIPDTKGRGFKH